MMEHLPIEFEIKGLSPLMMHNGHLADPFNPYVREMKKLTGKGKKKTDADHEELSRLEWEGGLYLNAERQVIIPGTNIEAALIEGGMKKKQGNEFKAGLLCDGDWPLIYEGPKDVAKMWKDGRFRDIRGVVNPSTRGRTMRTRPIFTPWRLKFVIHYLPDLLNPDQIVESLDTVGRIIGICDHTPKYGRFLRVA